MVPKKLSVKKARARIETTRGLLVVRLFPEVAPKHVANFCELADARFYDGLMFHRIVQDFVVQGGDPRGNGTGGPGYTIPHEFNRRPHRKGALSMSHGRSPNSAGSQFFFVHARRAAHLDGNFTVFGEIEDGLDVLDAIASVRVDKRDRPVSPVYMLKVTIDAAPVTTGRSIDGASLAVESSS